MKFVKVLSFFLSLCMIAGMIPAFGIVTTAESVASEKVVFVDGTKTNGDGSSPDTPFNTIGKAFSALPDGGTVVVCGDVAVSADNGGVLTLAAHAKPITVTSTWNNIDYNSSNSAKITADKTIYFSGDVTFTNIEIMTTDAAIQSNGTARIFYARGHALCFDVGVNCTQKESTSAYLTILGGNYSSHTGSSNITIKSGTFLHVAGGNWSGTFTGGESHVTVLGGSIKGNLYGANMAGTFKGNTHLTFTGGVVAGKLLTGGNGTGNLTGDVHVTVGGSASFPNGYTGDGFVAGTNGKSGGTYTLTGDIYCSIGGNANLASEVQIAGRYKGTTVKGNVFLTISDSAIIARNVFVGGYNTNVTGNTSVIMNGGKVGVNLCAGSRGGIITGNTYTELNGGKVGYHSSGNYDLLAGGGAGGGSVTGKATVLITGGDIANDVKASAGAGACGEVDITVKGGIINGCISGDGVGVTNQSKDVTVDLSSGNSLYIGKSSTVDAYIGGTAEKPAMLTLSSNNTLTVDGDMSGSTKLLIKGIEYTSGEYIKVTGDSSEADVSFFYLPDGNTFEKTDGGWTLTTPQTYETVNVIINKTTGTKIVARHGMEYDTTVITPDSDSDTKTVYTLSSGLYNFKVYYGTGASEYVRKYVYVSPTKQTKVVNIDIPAAPADGERYEKWYFELPDEVYDAYFNNNDLANFPESGYDTPTLSEKYENSRQYMSNDEMCGYIDALDAECDYMHVYNIALTENGYKIPLILFTSDWISDDATLEDAAKTVNTSKTPREIFFFTAQVHGNEPAPTDAHLAFAKKIATTSEGKALIDNPQVGAIVLIPCLNPEGAVTFTRSNPISKTNMNRDYMELPSIEIQSVVNAAHKFIPTVWADCHEDWIQTHESHSMYNPIISDNLTITGLKDIAVNGHGILNSSISNKDNPTDSGVIAANDAILMAHKLMGSLNDRGLHAGLYTSYVNAGIAQQYAAVIGAYGFIIETYGIGTAKNNYERRMYSMSSALEDLIALTLEDGNVAKQVAEGRKATAEKGLVFDQNDLIALQSTLTRSNAVSQLPVNKPIIYANGTMAQPENYTVQNFYDTISRGRARAGAYVFSKDAVNAAAVLKLLDMHNIEYHELAAGTSLVLRQYAGDVALASLTDSSNVTFESGAYIVFTDTCLGDLVSILFEPDNSDAGTENAVSLTQMELLDISEIYRSEQSYISRTLGFREMAGDIDHTFTLENADITLLVRVLAGFDIELDIGGRADVNADGKLNNRDAIELIRKISE